MKILFVQIPMSIPGCRARAPKSFCRPAMYCRRTKKGRHTQSSPNTACITFPEPKAGEPAVVMTYPISIGRMDWETPLGRTSVISKVTDPTWYPPASVRAEHAADGDPLPRIVPPGPKNPLGKFAMRLGIAGLPDTQHESPGRRWHAGNARLHPPVSRRHTISCLARSRQHAGTNHQRARQDRLERRRTGGMEVHQPLAITPPTRN